MARPHRLGKVNRVMSLSFPAYFIHHDNQVIWLLHQFRQAYDLFDAGQSHIERSPQGEAIRAAIRAADEEAFRSTHALYAISNAAKRLERYHGLHAPVLSAPLNDPELFSGGDDGGFIL